jgi:transcriptional regulator with AAA-type ATPase domain/tetratricopeptide (TPR) repeat protein
MVPTLLLQGETGTGKGLVARVVHESGPRARGPFIPVNCAAIPDSMLEAELFGYEAGAFTDAKRGKPGLFEAAVGGTLFLDEVDSLSLALQSKLLTAIESKHIRRLGAVTEHAVDVKLVAATQSDLGQLAAGVRFRPDLYHRLAVVVLTLPPLRERGDDVVVLARVLLARFATGYGVEPKLLTPEAEAWLRDYGWPGNVRELGHAMERVTLLHEEAHLDARTLERLVRPAAATPTPSRSGDVAPAEEPEETRRVREVLARTGGNVLRAARLLGMTREAVRYRMRRYGIERPDVDEPEPPRPTRASRRRPAEPDVAATASPGSGSEESGATTAADAAAPGPAASRWEQKPVAIVAIELVWPELAEGRPPSHEPWTENARWERVIREKLAGLGGVILQQSPSMVVWAFGVPQALDQLHQRAVHGALAVRNVTVGLAERERAPELRIAVHVGTMLVDTEGRDPAKQALPVGETLTTPVRLLAEAGPLEILASAAVARQVEAWVTLEPVEMQARSTRATGLGVYRVVGVSAWRERGPGTSRRALSPFTGRERELATLLELVRSVATGSGQAVGIVGEPGSGKSRLLYEFRRLLRGEAVRYAEAHCLAHGSMTPYLPLLEAAQYFGVSQSDSAQEVSEKVRSGLDAIGVDPDTYGPYILHVVSPGTMGGQPEGSDRQTFKARTFEALRQMAVGFARQQPFVFAVENVHWSDPTSEEFLSYLADRLTGTRCLLVTTYRPGYRPPWLERSYATQVALQPLGVEDSRRLARAVVGTAALSQETERELLARAMGNPLFLEELARAVVEEGGEAFAGRLPDTVQAVLAARIDRLSAADKSLLQTSAVIGREVSLAVLERVTGLGGAALEGRLARLMAGEFLFETAAATARTYAFKHPLTHAAAYQSLSPATRQLVHRRVLDSMEQLGEPRPEQLPELTHHAMQAGAWEKAVEYARGAAGQAQSRYAHREAASCYEQALAALAGLPGTVTLAQECGLRADLAHALYSAGELDRAAAEYREAQSLAERLGDERQLAQILWDLVYIHAHQGRYVEAVEAGERALTLADALGALRTKVWAGIGLGRAYFALGDYRQGIGRLRATLEALPAGPEDRVVSVQGDELPAVAVKTYLALCLARTGELDEGLVHGADAVQIAEARGGRLDRALAYYGLARVHHARTDFAQASELLERAAALIEPEAFPILFPRIPSGLASTYAQAGRPSEALPLLEQALAGAQSIALEYGKSLILVQLGETCLAAGRLEEAAGHAKEAFELSRDRGERGDEAWARHLLGEIASCREPAEPERARNWYREALALAEELGMRPLAARCRLSLGELEARRGGDQEARVWLAPAADDLRAMGVSAWLSRAEALLSTLDRSIGGTSVGPA